MTLGRLLKNNKALKHPVYVERKRSTVSYVMQKTTALKKRTLELNVHIPETQTTSQPPTPLVFQHLPKE